MVMLVLLIAAAALAAGAPDPRQAEIAWVVEGEFCEPETVLPLPDETLLVSNVCGFNEVGNGFLTLLSADGRVIDWRIVEGLDAPLGMSMSGDLLHVVDNNQVRVIRWPAYEQLQTIELETTVANDIAVAADGTMYITDTAQHVVVKRTTDGKQTLLIGESEFRGANGIEIDGDILYVGGERLWCVDLTTNTVTTIGPEWLTDIDGIEIEPDGTLQITPVAGPLVRYRGDDDIEILGGDGVSSANHGYAANLNLALIPTGFDNAVIAIRIPRRRDDMP